MQRSVHFGVATLVLIALLIAASSVQAAPFREDDHAQSFVSLGSASNRPTRLYLDGKRFLSFTVEVQDQTRGIVPSGVQGEMPEFNARRITGLIGIDLLPWLTLEGGAGMTDVELEGESADRDRDVEWRVGARLRLFDYRLPSEEPYYFRLESETFYRASESENWYSDFEWNELYSALLFGLSTHPLIHFGDDVRVVTLYGGPAVSLIDGEWSDDLGSSDFHEDQNLGGVLGLSFMPDEFMTLRIEGQFFDESSVSAALAIHF